jgi:hypothetical protein
VFFARVLVDSRGETGFDSATVKTKLNSGGMKMQDRKTAQLATALATLLGLSVSTAARAEDSAKSIFQIKTIIAQAGDTVQLDDDKGKDASCKGKEGSCKGKEGKKHKGKKGADSSCKGKEGSCKGKEGTTEESK